MVDVNDDAFGWLTVAPRSKTRHAVRRVATGPRRITTEESLAPVAECGARPTERFLNPGVPSQWWSRPYTSLPRCRRCEAEIKRSSSNVSVEPESQKPK